MTALLKKGTGNADRISISGKDALSYSFQIYGFDGDDILKGGKKNDFLSGGNGNDSLYSGIGNDVLFGGTGADTFIFNTALDNSNNSISVENAGFESGILSNSFQYLSGLQNSWTYHGAAGLAKNDSPWFAPSAPKGTQAVFIQGNGSGISQAIDFPVAGNYLINFSIVGRSGYIANDIAVKIDGSTLSTVTAANQNSTAWQTKSITYNCTTAGVHTLTFAGSNTNGDNGSAIDAIQIFPINSSIIRDFNPAEDKIQLDMSVFSKLSSGVLNSANFVSGGTANDVNDYLIYNSGTGVLSYDDDGSGANSSSMLAQLSPNLSLSNANFLVSLPSAMKDTLSALGTLSADQGSFSVSSNQIYTKNSLIPVASQAMSAVFSGLFGNTVTISQLNITTYDGNTAVSGLLSNGQRLTIILGNATAIDYAISGGMDLGNLTGLDFLKGIGLNSAEFVLSSEGVTVNNPTLGAIGVSRGATVIGVMDLSASSNQAFKFISNNLGIKSLVGYLSLDPEDGVALTGEVNTDITFIRTGGFSVTETQIALSAGVGFDLVPSIGISNTLEITGYDPTQSNEPTLALTGGVSFDPKSVTISANIDAAAAWNNPFGFQGAIIRNLGFQVGATYVAPFLDNIGFVTNVKWGNYDIDFAASIGITDPEKVAFTFTLNKEISAIQLFAQMNAMALGPAASTLINYASPLFNYIPFTIVSIDSDNNGALNPLVSFVPFPTSIGSYSLTQGMGIAGQVKFFGATGTMALQVNSTFTDMTGSLTINNLNLSWLTISGTQPGSDLTASFEISATHQYLKGDGKITMFGQTLAQAHFEFTPTTINISNTSFGLGNYISFNINYLNASLASQSASGSADITLFSHKTAGINFAMSSQQINFSSYLDLGDLDINGGFVWNNANNSLAISGAVMINGTTLAGGTVSYNGSAFGISGSSSGSQSGSDKQTFSKKILGITVKVSATVSYDVSYNAALSATYNGSNFNIAVSLDAHASGRASVSKIGSVSGSADTHFNFTLNSSSFSNTAIMDYVRSNMSLKVAGVGINLRSDDHSEKAEILNALTEKLNDVTINALSDQFDNLSSSVSYTLPNDVKNLSLLGADNIDATGNALNNTLTGNSGHNVLTGLQGNDKYYVNRGDTVIEEAHNGLDTVYSKVSFTLPENVENLTLLGNASHSATGNALNNLITGNAAQNSLTGGAGDDSFILVDFSQDIITDFIVSDDMIVLENTVFKQLVLGELSPAHFVLGASATNEADYILYDPATGIVRYDADGNGETPAEAIALLGSNLAITAQHFIVV